MRLSAPKNITFWIAVVLGVLGVVGFLSMGGVSGPGAIGFWLLFLGFALLAVANLIEGL